LKIIPLLIVDLLTKFYAITTLEEQ